MNADKPEIRPLTGLRALASWWVVLLHLSNNAAELFPASRSYQNFVREGNSGVDLFFVLSGFVLAYNYHDAFARASGTGYVKFLWQRLARIYPVHCLGLATWGAFGVLNIFLKHKSDVAGLYGAKTLVAQLFLVQSWSIPIVKSWNDPAWSLSMEWLAYLFFPLLIWWIMKCRGSIAWPVTILCALALAAPFFMASPAQHFVRIAAEFPAGCLLYLLYSRGFGRKALGRWPAAAALLAIVAFADRLGFFVLPLLVFLIYALLFDRGPAAAVLGSRPFMYWGRVSYSVYIMHWSTISACHYLLPIQKFAGSQWIVKAGVLGVYVALGAIAGVLAYHFVEEPCRASMRKWFRFDGAIAQTRAELVLAG